MKNSKQNSSTKKRLPRHPPAAARIFSEEALFEEMETAAALLQSGNDFGRSGIKHAVLACYSYLHVRGLSGQALKPLQDLASAIDDVTGGTLPELFDPKLKAGTLPNRRWTRSAAGSSVKLYAAACMDALMKQGVPKKRAAERVTRATEKWPRLSQGVINPNTVANWRDEFLQRPTNDEARTQFHRLSRSLSEGPRAKIYLDEVLRRGPALTGGIRKQPKT